MPGNGTPDKDDNAKAYRDEPGKCKTSINSKTDKPNSKENYCYNVGDIRFIHIV